MEQVEVSPPSKKIPLVSSEAGVTIPKKTLKKRVKIPSGTIKIQFAGDLILARCPDKAFSQPFKKYEILFENLANLPKEDRLVKYKFLCGLILTSYAKKCVDRPLRRQIFDLKNEIFLNLANNKALRKEHLGLRYLTSKQILVKEYCPKCVEANTTAGLNKYVWKHCRECTIDPDFYNLLSIQHKFKGGFARLFLSHEHVQQVMDLRNVPQGKSTGVREEMALANLRFPTRTLDVFEWESVKKMQAKLVGAGVSRNT